MCLRDRFNVSWSQERVLPVNVSGTVQIENPAATSLQLTRVRVELLSGSTANMLSNVTGEAMCRDLIVPAGGTTACSYSLNAELALAPGATSAEAQVRVAADLKGNVTLSPATVRFDAAAPAAVGSGSSSNSSGCAELIAGVMMGSPLLLPGAAGPVQPSTLRVCEPGSRMLSQPVGPFTASQCGRYTVRHVGIAPPSSHASAARTNSSCLYSCHITD